MEITPALGAATMLQTRVGQSMALVQNQLAPPERAGVLLQTGSQSITTAVLTGMKEVQQQSLEKLNAICGFLETQVEIEREKERRLREQSRELEKERLGVDAGENIPEPEITPPTGENKLKSFFGGLDLADVLTLGLATSLAAAGGAKAFAKKLGPKLIKGGIYAAIASAVAKPFVDFITGPGALDLELAEGEKEKMSDALIGAIGLGTIAGPMGVIVGAIGGYTKDSIIEAYKFVSGKIDASQIKDPEKVFGETALAAGAAGVFTSAMIGKAFVTAGGSFATVGAALVSLSVLIGVGVGAASLVGIKYLKGKVEEYQERTLQGAEVFADKLKHEMGLIAANEEESLLERMGLNLGKQSTIGMTQIATSEASEQVKNQGIEALDRTEISGLTKAVEGFTNFSDEALIKVMSDRTKATNFFQAVTDLKFLATQGAFGLSSKDYFEHLSKLQNRAQNLALDQVARGNREGSLQQIAGNTFGYGTDELEKIIPLIQNQQRTIMDIEDTKGQIRALEVALKAAKDDRSRLQDTNFVGDLARMLGDTINVGTDIGTLEGKINRKKNQLRDDIVALNTAAGRLDAIFGGNQDYTLSMLMQLYKGDEERLKNLIAKSMPNPELNALKNTTIMDNAPFGAMMYQNNSGNIVSKKSDINVNANVKAIQLDRELEIEQGFNP